MFAGQFEQAAHLFTAALRLLERSGAHTGCAAGRDHTSDAAHLAAKFLSNRAACWNSAGDHATALLDAIAARKEVANLLAASCFLAACLLRVRCCAGPSVEPAAAA